MEDCILVGIFASSPLFFRVSRLAVQKFGKMSVFSSFFFFIFSTSWSLHLPLPQLFYFWHGKIQQCLASNQDKNVFKKQFLANSMLFFGGEIWECHDHQVNQKRESRSHEEKEEEEEWLSQLTKKGLFPKPNLNPRKKGRIPRG